VPDSAGREPSQKLEEEIGAPLCPRHAELLLTSAGKMFESARRMVQLRNETVRQLGSCVTLVAASLSITAHESAAVLLPGPLRGPPALSARPGRHLPHRLGDIPRQVMDREVDMIREGRARLSRNSLPAGPLG
jgi:hypothetical protein